MLSKFCRVASFGLLLTVAALGSQSPALAGTLLDNYDGGLNYCCQSSLTPQSGDVIGPANVFDITSAVVSLNTNTPGGTLTVTINTYYAGVPGTANADGTGYGSLFLGPAATWNPTGPAPYITDQYNPAEWIYAFVSNSNGSGAVYSTGNNPTPVTYGTPATNPAGVYQYYQTSTGQVVMSNVNGNPISYPNGGNPGYWFRQGQAVQFNPSQSTASTASGSWSVVPTSVSEGSITYVIDDYAALGLGPEIALSWAMTCANDIIQGTVSVFTGEGDNPNPTPIPAALPLFAAGLGLLGFAGSRRRRNTAMTKVAG
jgi:hypothetical protein